jgi:hypothetical protein
MLRTKNCERANKNQTDSHEIEPNPPKNKAMHEGDNPSFWDQLIKFLFFFLDTSIRISKLSPEIPVPQRIGTCDVRILVSY